MDYSSSIHEGEDPAASPWGNSPGSSPRVNRTAYGNVSGEPPSSPFRYSSETSNGQAPAAEPENFQQPGATPTRTVADSDTTESTTLTPPAEPTDEAAAASDPSQPDDSPQDSRFAPQAPPGSQPEASQQPQKRAPPQYRLQAKITGLERTGKKDPILRFDVYVRCTEAGFFREPIG